MTPVTYGMSQMTVLAQSFPTLRGAPGTVPWDQHAFAAWLAGPAPSNAIRQAGLFVLSVWNGCNGSDESPPWWVTDHGLPLFDAVFAFAVWDHAHREAFNQWCEEPFYP